MQCSRCDNEGVTKTRGEYFCSSCFQDFIDKKVRSTMGHFRVTGASNQPLPKIVVGVSFGPSSLALVDLLSKMLSSQKEKYNGMVGFEIECVYFAPKPFPTEKWLWPHISYKQLAEPALPLTNDESPSRSTLQDMKAVMLRKALIEVAREKGATAAFGYSMTKLSELTLSETIKGRGANIPGIVYPDIVKDHVVHPLHEITIPELKEYCRLRDLEKLIIPDPIPPGITKMQSIDEMVRDYFAQIRKDYPSIVSTVSKVASRLSQDPEPCVLCQTASPTEDSSELELCYACRSALGKPRLSEPLDVLRDYEL